MAAAAPQATSTTVAVLFREVFGLPDAFSFTARVGAAGTDYEAKDALTERLSFKLPMHDQFNYTLMYSGENLPEHLEVHLRFMDRAATLLGESKVLLEELQSKSGLFVAVPVCGSTAHAVFLTSPEFTEYSIAHAADVASQDQGNFCGGTAVNWLQNSFANTFYSLGKFKDFMGTMGTLTTFGLSALSSPFGMLDYTRERAGPKGYWHGFRTESSTQFTTWEDTKKKLEELGPRLGTNNFDGDAYRMPYLGPFSIKNNDMWPELKGEGSIVLGFNQEMHGFVRKYLANAVGAEGSADWTTGMIKEYAKNFWKGRKSIKCVEECNVYTQQVLQKILLGHDITAEDAIDFMKMKDKIIEGTTTFFDSDPSIVFPLLGIDKAIAAKSTRIEAAKPLLQAKYSDTKFTDRELTILASGVMDALMFAGGNSIPDAIRTMFIVLFSDFGKKQLGEDFKLRKSTVKLFVYEVERHFPPVSEVCWVVKNKTGLKQEDWIEWVNLFTACKDPKAWGPDSDQFKLRSFEEYHQKHMAWADTALHNGKNEAPNSHVCPGKDLSLVMLSEFLIAMMVETIGQEAVDRDEPFDLHKHWTSSNKQEPTMTFLYKDFVVSRV